ncbi:MAG: hypothetical protein CMH63_02340 [Nanoarchaeota archaeon]|jgi:RimJ/RimL family protein N-acetyltransferase|nr:hypothetical protein [Nanoarchaeota archaeon]|tara:strand:+ start:7358 stop:7900 length:543 start_codon:yes stop_codon:yes gene_type:complete
MKLSTERLNLREFTLKDAKQVVRNIGNLKVSRYLLVVPHPYSLKDAKWWLNQCQTEVRKRPREKYNLAIELKDHTLMGGVSLNKVDRYQGTADIGYYLGEDFWRQGYMTEAATAIINFAFDKLKLRRLQAPIFRENKASQGLAKSLGFKKEGLLRKVARAKSTGKIHDEVVYGLLKEDWK